ncbi:hypothetical protein ABIB42_003276 [Massilia sp. UYP32]|jgi:hypothetical protein|uniref:Uncharacterized protein n=1 Tax=Massilia timonae CCUG 45783 TaxID=883126 RepID=K9E0P8_9BURK|nr:MULTISPECIES: hypothetical protein [Massilia]EKU82970.1 hypothetical protein HMPREF9710_01699 [Massilia timonae CCUG 45783]QYF99542.1 hypothetical protein KY496_13950 [Massilia sp. NP310]
MQAAQPPTDAPSPADPGFKLPEESASPQDAVQQTMPQTLPDTATRPVEVMPVDPHTLPVADTSDRDLAIGGIVFLILLSVYFFVRGAYVHHLVRKRVAPSSAGNAGWLLFVGLGFLSAAAVLAIINASRFLTFAVTGPLVAVGLVALVASLFIGRR